MKTTLLLQGGLKGIAQRTKNQLQNRDNNPPITGWVERFNPGGGGNTAMGNNNPPITGWVER